MGAALWNHALAQTAAPLNKLLKSHVMLQFAFFFCLYLWCKIQFKCRVSLVSRDFNLSITGACEEEH